MKITSKIDDKPGMHFRDLADGDVFSPTADGFYRSETHFLYMKTDRTGQAINLETGCLDGFDPDIPVQKLECELIVLN